MTLALLILYGVLVVLNSLDGYSTWKVLKPHHYRREHNPLARRIFQKLGIPRGIIVAELLWIGFISLVFFLLWDKPALNGVLLVLLSIGVLAFAWVVASNFRAYRRIKTAQGRRSEELLQARKQC